ncbi:16S rRNA (guanine(966)-N(2))-methyltransferase RsmD [Gardnerella vaginalis]|uniref:RNA methyltransferase, RsmD family n=1 Tax=Gardnerella vaginalis JCP8108 TaxID=1261066 RepID=S4GPL7_GARVA|nr:16S rRNA (guanine(966)-N(2))-methyltransferase RsmD [Gardnerella vaginalis]EPI46394.1 RNA methyltransferase, RsmD family [Gardnerella vaginalis JCP8108]
MHVIAGRFKGTPLCAAKSCTRPTTDRTKEAIFSRLDSWEVCDGARVLDLFAGTAALGIEAISRGAKELVCVEANAAAAALITKTVKVLQSKSEWSEELSVRVNKKRAEQFVQDYSGEAFDLVFIDPPYALETEQVERLIENMVSRSVVSATADTLIVLERSARSVVPTICSGWEIFDTRNYGETTVMFIQSTRFD